MDHRERNDSKSRLAIPNSFLHDFGHRRIFRLPIFGRGFCRFHFDCECSLQIPTDCYLMFCQSIRCATDFASDMRVGRLVACRTSLYLRIGHFAGFSGWWVELSQELFDECVDHRERNDSKSRLAIPNSFLHGFGHRCILGLPIFGRGFCRFHFVVNALFKFQPIVI
jgi:hypothetical protein